MTRYRAFSYYSLPLFTFLFHRYSLPMINTLLPLLLAPFMHATEPAMMPAHEHHRMMVDGTMPMMEDQTDEPVTRADVSPMERRMMQRNLHEQPMHVRRKGFEESSYWYRSARIEHAEHTIKPEMQSTDLTQRTHRGMVEWSRRTERRMRGFPRGCAFPCTE